MWYKLTVYHTISCTLSTNTAYNNELYAITHTNMNEIKRKWDLLPKAKRKSCIDEIITFFKQKRDEQIGVIAAEDILDFFLQDIGTEIYNKGVEDSKGLLKKEFENLEVDLDLLMNK